MDIFFSALLQVLAPHTFGIMLVGIAVGLVVGILPGLGGAATLAMMMPFVYPLDAISAFAFLLGMHAVTATTGDITSVLFAIPGEATTVATMPRRRSPRCESTSGPRPAPFRTSPTRVPASGGC
jgi:TctA family transporter